LKTIKAKNTVIVNKNIDSVFEFISNLENDSLWRKEINETKVSGKPALNVIVIEDSFLSKRTPSNIIELKCIDFQLNKLIVYETANEKYFYLKSTREVESITDNSTKITYSIEFDKAIVKHGLGFNLPTFLIQFVTNTDMKKYLSKLKTII
jgi:uncharacterized membrane protein